MDVLLGPDFWIGLFKIIWINIILSGDNAVVIALAARGLPPEVSRRLLVQAFIGDAFVALEDDARREALMQVALDKLERHL